MQQGIRRQAGPNGRMLIRTLVGPLNERLSRHVLAGVLVEGKRPYWASARVPAMKELASLFCNELGIGVDGAAKLEALVEERAILTGALADERISVGDCRAGMAAEASIERARPYFEVEEPGEFERIAGEARRLAEALDSMPDSRENGATVMIVFDDVSMLKFVHSLCIANANGTKKLLGTEFQLFEDMSTHFLDELGARFNGRNQNHPWVN